MTGDHDTRSVPGGVGSPVEPKLTHISNIDLLTLAASLNFKHQSFFKGNGLYKHHLLLVNIVDTKVDIPEIPEFIRVSHAILSAVHTIGVQVAIGTLELELILEHVVSISSSELCMFVTPVPDVGITDEEKNI